MEEETDIGQENVLSEQKRIDQPKKEFLKDKYCEVCFKFNDIAKGQAQETEKEEGLQMMYCYECQTCVHKYCYGLNTKTTVETNSEGEKYLRFLCDRCRYKDTKKEISCIICHGKTGAFKLLSNAVSYNQEKSQRQTRGQQQEFIHVTCGLFIEPQSIILTSFKEMQFKKYGNLNIQKQLQTEKCFYCEGNIGLFKCTGDQSCQNYCHIRCALLNKVNEALDVGVGVDAQQKSQNWNIKFKMIPSQNLMKYFDPQNQYNQQLLGNIETLISQYFDATQHKEWKEKLKLQEATEKMEIEEEQIEQQKEQKDKKKQKKAKNRGGSSIDMRREVSKYLTECKDAILSACFQHKQPSLDHNNHTLGGQLILECPCHAKEELFCKCQQPYDILKNYLACDYCDNWFHYTCIEMTQEDVDRIGVYFCNECKAWEKFRDQLKKGIPVKQLPQELSSNYMDRFTIVDFIIGEIFCEELVTKKSRNQKGLESIVNEVKKFPIQSWTIIGDLWKEVGIQVAIERLGQLFQKRVEVEKDIEIAQQGLKVFENNNEIIGVKWVQWWIQAQEVFVTETKIKPFTLELLVAEGKSLKGEQELLQKLTEQLELYKKVKDLCDQLKNGTQISELDLNKLQSSLKQLIVEMNAEDQLLEKLNIELDTWKQNWQQSTLSLSEMQKLLREGENLRVSIPELEESRKLWMEFKDWEEIMRAIIKGERKEMAMSVDKFKKEVEDGERKFEKLELSDLDSEFQKKIVSGEAMKERIQKALTGQMDYNALKKLKKEIISQEFHFQELEEINSKLKAHKEMAYFLNNKRASLNLLEDNLKIARENNMEEKLTQDIIQKLAHGRNLLAKAQELSNKNILDENDDKEAETIINDIKNSKFDLPEIMKKLENLVCSFKWLQKLNALWKKLNDQYEKENTNQKTKNDEYIEIDFCKSQLDKIVEVCFKTHVLEQSFKQYLRDFETLIKEGSSIEFQDDRFLDLFNRYEQIVWNYKANEFIKSLSVNETELKTLSKKTTIKQMNTELQTRIQEKYQLVEQFQNSFSEKWGMNEEVIAQIDSNLENFISELDSLKEEYKTIQVDMEKEGPRIQELSRWAQWHLETKGLINQTDKSISFNQLKEIHEKSKGIAKSELILKVSNMFNRCSKVLTWFTEFKDKQEKFKIQQRQGEMTRKKLFKLLEGKSELEQVKNWLMEVQGICVDKVKEVNDKLSEEIQISEEFYEKVEEFCKEKIKTNVKKMNETEVKQIKEWFVQFKGQILQSIPLRVERIDKEVFALEIKFYAFLLLEQMEVGGIEKWRHVIQFAESFEGLITEQAEWYQEMQQQVKSATELLKDIANLSQVQMQIGKLPTMKEIQLYRKNNCVQLKQFEKIKFQLSICKVNIAEQKAYIDGLQENIRKINTKFQTFSQKNEKLLLPDYQKLQEQILKMPIIFPEEETAIEISLDNYHKLGKQLEKIKHFCNYLNGIQTAQPNQLSLEVAERIVKMYENCEIFHSDAQKFAQCFDDSKKVMEYIEEEVDKYEKNIELLLQFWFIQFFISILSYDDLLSISSKFDEILINFGINYTQISMKLWLLKVKFCQKLQQDNKNQLLLTSINSLPKVTYKQLKNYLMDGYNQLQSMHQVQCMKQQIIYLENLLFEIEKKLKQIGQIQDKSKIEEMPKVLYDFVDISEEVIEYLIDLEYNPNPSININSIVKSPFDIYKGDESDLPYMLNYLSNKDTATSAIEQESPLQYEKSAKEKKQFVGKSQTKSSSFKQMFGQSSRPSGKRQIHMPQQYMQDFVVKTSFKYDDDIQVVGQDVSDGKRKQFTSELERMISENPKFKMKSIEKEIPFQVKIIENQVFGEYHSNYSKYLNEAKLYKELFYNLQTLPYLSANILAKKFNLQMIQKLIGRSHNNLINLEAIAKQKEKQKYTGIKKTSNITIASVKVGQPIKKVHKEESLPTQIPAKPKPVQHLDITKLIPEVPKKKTESVPRPLTILDKLQMQDEKRLATKAKKPKTQQQFLEKLSDDEEKTKTSSHREAEYMDEELKQAEFSDDPSSEVEKAMELEAQYQQEQEQITLAASQPILHDPDAEEEEEQRKLIKEQKKKVEPEQKFTPPAPGSTLLIFSGKLKLNHQYVQLSLLTKESYSKLLRFPEIIQQIKITGLLDLNKFIDFYVHAQGQGKREMTVGWVSTDEQMEAAEQFALHLLQHKKVAGIKYSPLATIHLFHREEFCTNQSLRAITNQKFPTKCCLVFVITCKGMKGEKGIKGKEVELTKSEEMSPLTEEEERENYGEILEGLGDVLKDVVDRKEEEQSIKEDVVEIQEQEQQQEQQQQQQQQQQQEEEQPPQQEQQQSQQQLEQTKQQEEQKADEMQEIFDLVSRMNQDQINVILDEFDSETKEKIIQILNKDRQIIQNPVQPQPQLPFIPPAIPYYQIQPRQQQMGIPQIFQPGQLDQQQQQMQPSNEQAQFESRNKPSRFSDSFPLQSQHFSNVVYNAFIIIISQFPMQQQQQQFRNQQKNVPYQQKQYNFKPSAQPQQPYQMQQNQQQQPQTYQKPQQAYNQPSKGNYKSN